MQSAGENHFLFHSRCARSREEFRVGRIPLNITSQTYKVSGETVSQSDTNQFLMEIFIHTIANLTQDNEENVLRCWLLVILFFRVGLEEQLGTFVHGHIQLLIIQILRSGIQN
jgi:hypothetical protein